MKILVANISSTSLKWRLYDFSFNNERLLHKGGLERIIDYPKAIDDCLAQLRTAGAIISEKDLAAVGFRTVVAQGVVGWVQIDDSVLKAMEAFNGLAPTDNPPCINGIRLFAKRLPDVPLVGLFETAFYGFAPEAAMRYAVPDSWYRAGVRRWGFHGASHKFIAERSAELLGRNDVVERVRHLYVDGGTTPVNQPDLRVISCHLGPSSSITGILNGVAIGNSMGFSPQSGLPQNTRVGDLDPFAVPFAMRTLKLSLTEVERHLCKESGMKGVSGVSNDIGDIQAAAAKGSARAKLALDVFAGGVRHWLGSFLVQLNGADALVFTASIGENNPATRADICANLDQLGIVLDAAKNQAAQAQEATISAANSRVKVMVIPTNEDLVVARETKRFLEMPKGWSIF